MTDITPRLEYDASCENPDPALFDKARSAGAEVTDHINYSYDSDVAVFTLEALNAFAETVRSAERERMIADGWRQTRYVVPVTDCEGCLTPDACSIRGQCAHYLRENTP